MRTPGFLSSIYHIFFSNLKTWPIWTVARIYLGYVWIMAGYEKVVNPAWTGENGGAPVVAFVKGAMIKTTFENPDVSLWYAWFLEHAVLPYAGSWSLVVAYGEVLVGVGLILGAFTFLAAFFGAFMNMNYLLAGTVGTNPVLLLLSILIMTAHRVAGYAGLDYYILKTGR